jgi:hypothetical protein
MEDLEMKKLFVLSIAVLFALLGTQAFASPPVAPPVEGFIITTTTEIVCDGDVTEKEAYNWKYFEGWGKGVFFPDGIPACATCGEGGSYVKGFTEGAEIAYQQNFNAIDGVTTFKKDFWASSKANSDGDNLTVDKIIIYDKNAGGNGMATHTEKLGLSVISMGASSSSTETPGTGLLTLCPWATGQGTPGTTPGYPPTNEGIAAGSSFNVSNINFTSNSAVSTTVNPALKYAVVADGEGSIAAGFVVELFEGPAGFVWEMTNTNTLGTAGTDCWIPPACAPPLASRTSYSEHATADGVWAFKKAVAYTSIMPAGVSGASGVPIGQVP